MCFLLPDVDKQHIWIKMKPSVLREEIAQIWIEIFYQKFLAVGSVREKEEWGLRGLGGKTRMTILKSFWKMSDFQSLLSKMFPIHDEQSLFWTL